MLSQETVYYVPQFNTLNVVKINVHFLFFFSFENQILATTDFGFFSRANSCGMIYSSVSVNKTNVACIAMNVCSATLKYCRIEFQFLVESLVSPHPDQNSLPLLLLGQEADAVYRWVSRRDM